jgi:hypothetical protein
MLMAWTIFCADWDGGYVICEPHIHGARRSLRMCAGFTGHTWVISNVAKRT